MPRYTADDQGEGHGRAGGSPSSSSFSLADELLSYPTSQEDASASTYLIPNEVNVPDMDAAELAHTLHAAIDLIAASSSSGGSLGADPILPDSGTELDLFDTLRSFLFHYQSLAGVAPTLQAKLLDAISTGLAGALDAAARDEASAQDYPMHREALERWGFLVQWFVAVAERVHRKSASSASTSSAAAGSKKKSSTITSKEQFSWTDSLPPLLALLGKALRSIQSARLWTTTIDRDAFISGCFLRPVFLLLENEAYLKASPTTTAAAAAHHNQPQGLQLLGKNNPIKAGITRLICLAIQKHSQSASTLSLCLQSLQYYEHLSEYLAEMLYVLRVEYDASERSLLADELLRQIGARSFGSSASASGTTSTAGAGAGGADAKSARSFGRFLVRTAELNPASARRAIVHLRRHLDTDPYPLRNALLEVLGLLIRDLVLSEDPAFGAGNGNSRGRGDDDEGPRTRGTRRDRGEDDDEEEELEEGNTGRREGEKGGATAADTPEARKKQIETFWDLLLERFLDLNSYVRSKTVAVCNKLLE